MTVGLYKREADIMDKIQAELGSGISDVVREMIRKYGDEHFPSEPGYVQIQKDRLELKKEIISKEINFKKMTNEDYAVNILKARVSKGHAWFCTGSTNPWPVELNAIKELTPEAKTVTDHIKILNGEPFFYSNGQEMKASEQKQAVAKWKAA